MTENSSDSDFHLKWEDYAANLNMRIGEIRNAGDFFNVTLVCGDQQISAHKLILSAFSDFFKAILVKNKHDHPLIYMHGINYTDMHAILDFVYTGETVIEEENFMKVMKTAKDLGIRGMEYQKEDKTFLDEEEHQDTEESEQNRSLDDSKEESKEIEIIEDPPMDEEDCDVVYDMKSTQESEASKDSTKRKKTNKTKKITKKKNNKSKISKSKESEGTHEELETIGEVDIEQERLVTKVNSLLDSYLCPTTKLTMWQCLKCEFSHRQKSHVRDHAERHISGFSHTCSNCLKNFSTRNSLRVHKIRSHSCGTNRSKPVER